MKANFGVLPPLEGNIKSKKERNRLLAERSLEILKKFVEENQLKL